MLVDAVSFLREQDRILRILVEDDLMDREAMIGLLKKDRLLCGSGWELPGCPSNVERPKL